MELSHEWIWIIAIETCHNLNEKHRQQIKNIIDFFRQSITEVVTSYHIIEEFTRWVVIRKRQIK